MKRKENGTPVSQSVYFQKDFLHDLLGWLNQYSIDVEDQTKKLIVQLPVDDEFHMYYPFDLGKAEELLILLKKYRGKMFKKHKRYDFSD